MRNNIVPFVRVSTAERLVEEELSLWQLAEAANEDVLVLRQDIELLIESGWGLSAGPLSALFYSQVDYIRHLADYVFFWLDQQEDK